MVAKDTKLMGTSEAAAYLNVNVETINYHVRVKRLKPRMIAGRRTFTVEQLDALRPELGRRGPKPKKPEARR